MPQMPPSSRHASQDDAHQRRREAEQQSLRINPQLPLSGPSRASQWLTAPSSTGSGSTTRRRTKSWVTSILGLKGGGGGSSTTSSHSGRASSVDLRPSSNTSSGRLSPWLRAATHSSREPLLGRMRRSTSHPDRFAAAFGGEESATAASLSQVSSGLSGYVRAATGSGNGAAGEANPPPVSSLVLHRPAEAPTEQRLYPAPPNFLTLDTTSSGAGQSDPQLDQSREHLRPARSSSALSPTQVQQLGAALSAVSPAADLSGVAGPSTSQAPAASATVRRKPVPAVAAAAAAYLNKALPPPPPPSSSTGSASAGPRSRSALSSSSGTWRTAASASRATASEAVAARDSSTGAPASSLSGSDSKTPSLRTAASSAHAHSASPSSRTPSVTSSARSSAATTAVTRLLTDEEIERRTDEAVSGRPLVE